jgi:N-acetylglucosamine malate deacetylase 2
MMKSDTRDDNSLGRELSAALASRAGAFLDRLRPLILAAHQDDETLGASIPLALFPDCTVAFLTDGSPRDARFRSAHQTASQVSYADIRREEALQALACAGPVATYWFGCTDQEAINNISQLVSNLVELVQQRRPDIIVTHAYEGGHPDHDAAALIAHLAHALLKNERETSPPLWEMALYHARNEQLVTGEFFSDSTPPLVLQLSLAERLRKQRMLDCYRSQSAVLRSFEVEREMFRPAPAYDFTHPPHPGKLWYECLGWPMTARKWCDVAAAAMSKYERNLCL